jgi:hypothetical protein
MTLPERSLQGTCPVGNYCEITASPDGAPCGTLVNHMTVLLPAEKVCMRALDGRATAVADAIGQVVRSDMQQQITGIETIWYGVEKALNNSTPEQQAYEYLAEAERFAGHIASGNNMRYELKADAREVELHTPIYRARINNLPPTTRHRRILGEGLAEVYEWLMRAPVHTVKTHGLHLGQPNHVPCVTSEDSRAAYLPSLGLQMLALRIGKVFSPSSRRENQLKGAKAYRHDRYLYENGVKYPVRIVSDGRTRIKQSGNPEQSTILYLSLDEIIQEGFTAYGKDISMKSAKKSAPGLVAALHAEIRHGKDIGPELQRFLDMASTALRNSLAAFTNDFEGNALAEQASWDSEAKVEWTNLARDSRRWKSLVSGGAYAKNRHRVDFTRIEKLDRLLEEWGDGYPSVANLKSTGEFDYVAIVLRDKIAGLVIEHAIAENPGINNAMFGFRGEKGVVNGKVVKTWRDVLLGSSQMLKRQVEYLGAHRIVHTVNADSNLLDFLTRPDVA